MDGIRPSSHVASPLNQLKSLPVGPVGPISSTGRSGSTESNGYIGVAMVALRMRLGPPWAFLKVRSCQHATRDWVNRLYLLSIGT